MAGYLFTKQMIMEQVLAVLKAADKVVEQVVVVKEPGKQASTDPNLQLVFTDDIRDPFELVEENAIDK